jgi:amino acid adenylation domain-containing protein
MESTVRKEINENILLFSSRFLTQREYWEKKLAGDIGETTLLLHKMNLNQKPVIEAEDIFLPGHICRQLINISKNFDLSIYIILLTALKTLIFRYTLNEDVTVLSPLYKLNISKDTINDRLFIRDRITGNMTFKELILEVKKSVVEAYKHQDYPFEKLFELLFPDSRIEDMPISNLECSLKNIHKETNRDEIRGKISFSFVREEDKIKGNILYDSNTYEKYYIQQVLNHCVKVLETGSHDINITIGEISFLSGREKKQLLIEFNNNKANFPRDKSIHQLFESQAHKNPLNTALKFEGEQLTYSGLKERVDRLAGVLRRRGIGKDKLVGVLLERSPLMAESILAVWKEGGAYIPIDPPYPVKRIIDILKDSNAEVLLTTDQWNRPELEEAFGQIITRLDQPLDGLTGDSVPGTEVERPMDMDSLAYIIYTSGSTGKPKGAMVEHLGMMNHIQAKIHDLQLTGESIIAQNASHTFDISVWQFFTALTLGAKTVIYPDELVLNPGRFISQVVKDQVTILEIVPSYLAILLEFLEGQTFAPLVVNYLLVTGETVKPALVKKWFEKYPGIKMVNAYGPTEASDDITHHIMDNAPDIEQVPIGKSLQNMNIYIVDRRMQLCPIGVKGEIYVSGVGVGRGYLNNLERTTEVFMENPFVSPITNDRLYRTGDLGCWFPDGTILFFGRKDYQVKIRGYRIELGEIENQLLKHEKIKDAVVIDRESHTGDPGKGKGETYLCAYIVLNEKSGDGTAGEKSLTFLTELKEYLSKRLPEYMIPPKFLFLEKFPLTTSGKVDRKALPVPDEVPVEEYIAPRDEVEKKLAKIWSEVLDRDAWDASIGIDNNFFEMGGHSLKASVIVWKIHKELNVKIPLAEIFEIPTIRGLAEYIKGTAENRYASIEPVEKKEFYVLSSAQKRLYILHQMDPESTAYNIPEVIPLGEEPDPGKFEETFIKLINRHESLRTSFHMIGDEPSQRIHDKVEFAIDYYDLTAKKREDTRSENEIHHSHQSFIEQFHHFVRPFDLSRAPLLRVGLIKTGDARYLLMVDMHHIISDGVSHDILVRDFMKLYEGREVALLRIQYKDFSKWQNGENEKENLKHQEAHWLKEFAGEIPVLDLPADYVRPTIQSFEGSVLVFEVPVEEIEAIQALALGHGSTLFMALLSVFYIFLSRLSGQEDIIVGTPIAGRRHADLEKIIGMFVNTLALRNYPTGEKSFLEFLEEVKQQTLEAFENQEYQFEDLVEKVAIERNTGRNPLFDVMFVLQNINTEYDDSSGEQITEDSGSRSAQDSSPYEYQNIIRTSQFDFTFNAIERDEGFLFSFLYCTKLFKKETIERFATTYKKIISSIAKEPGMKLSQIEVIGEEERNQVLYNFNNTDCPYPGDKSLHQLFEDQAAKRGDSIAVISMEHGTRSTKRTVGIGTMSITYRQLNEISDRLACYLREKGVAPDSIVGITVERSMEMIVGIFGILKAGGAYLPIDPGYPQERVRYMLTDSNAKILMSGMSKVRGVNEVIDLNQLTDAATPPRPNPPTYPITPLHSSTQPGPSNLAYIIYTSGSTGRPKGVMLQHRSVVNRLNWMQRAYPIGYEDIILQKTPYIFDVSVWEIFWWSLQGASVCLLACGEEKNPGAIIDAIEKNKVTTMHFVPAMLNTFLAYLEDETVERRRLAGLRQVFASGEALEVIHVEQFNRLIHEKTGAMLINLYGPTEAAVDVSFFDCTPSPGLGRIPIGKPIDNIRLYIVNRYFRLQPIGIAGELCISGVGLARGYLNNPELTANKFDRDFQDSQDDQDEKEKKMGTGKYSSTSLPLYPSTSLYHTGDLAKWRPDGNIDFLGRIDYQVKIRGFRIELGEIENQMLSHVQIKEAVVTIVKDKSGDNALAAYFISDSEIQENELREYLLKFLPDYMIPSYVIRLDNIPLTPTGKIDRKALPAPGIKVGKEYVEPRNEVEEKLAEIWEDVLGIEKSLIGIDTNFFQLGGHSLKATILASKIREVFNVNIPLVELFKTPTIKSIWEFIRKAEIGDFLKGDDNLVLLKLGNTNTNHLFLVHDGTGEIETYIHFSNRLNNEFNYWGIRADQLENLTPQNWTTEGLARKYIESIKKVQPPGSGPYFIAGWSIGGTIAFEIARQLEKEKEQVAFLGLIDSKSPSIWRWLVGKVFPGKFNRRSELKCIRKVLVMEFEIEKKAGKIKNMKSFWSEIADYLETSRLDNKEIKRKINTFGRQVLPNFQRLSVKECIYYLNMGRSLTRAADNYIPPGKINAPVFYFKANLFWEMKVKRWKKYTQNPIQIYELAGDHQTIFTIPYVYDFAKIFDQAVNKIVDHIPPGNNVSNK